MTQLPTSTDIPSVSADLLSTTRRNFLKAGVTASGGLSLAMLLPGCSALLKDEVSEDGRWQANAWLQMEADGTVLFTLDRVEMGQGTETGLTTLLAEELDVAPATIKVSFAPAHSDYRNPDYGLQLTGGSNSLSAAWQPLRETGAAARAMLIAAAASVWSVSKDNLETQDGFVVDRARQRRLPYSRLVGLAALQSVPSDIALKQPPYKYIGQSGRRLDGLKKVTGQAGYGIDVNVPGMVYAVVSRCPYIGGNLLSVDPSKARDMPGVIDIVVIDRGVAVVAKSYWQARKAQQALSIQWQRGSLKADSSDALSAYYRQQADADSGDIKRDEGDYLDLKAPKTIQAEYSAPFLAHATMEPMNATVHVQESRADVWAPTQAPDIAQVAVAKVSHLSPSDVDVHTTYLGGGFGRRLTQDFVEEAAAISARIKRPVKVIWSREEDTQHDWYRPASYHRLAAKLDESGQVLGWQHQIVAPKIFDWFVWDAAPAQFPWAPKAMYRLLGNVGLMTEGTPITPEDHSPTEGAKELPYAIPNIDIRHTKADAGIPVSFWRSVGHSQNAFVVESFIDELAHVSGSDPLAFRLNLLAASPRHQTVLRLAAEKAGWPRVDPGRALGIACHQSFGSFAAQVIEVSVQGSSIKVHRVVCAIDCGQVVNPDVVAMQMESGIIFGLTAALYGDITLDDGQVQQSNFDDYPLLRMYESPDIEVHVVPSTVSPTGVGEPGVPPVAPALANAVYAATGQRLRTLPLKLDVS